MAFIFYAAIGLPLASSQIAQLTAFSRANGPSSSGSALTIHGAHFGFATSVVDARISGTACTNTKWISDSSMTTVAPGAGVSFQDAVVVTFQGVVVHTELKVFTFDAPVLSVTRKNSPAHASGILTFTGSGIGSYDISPKGRIGDTACMSTDWTSYEQITCLIAPGTAFGNGRSASMVLSLAASGSGRSTVSNAFTYDAPSITALFDGTGAMSNGPAAGGNTITATGENFGTYDRSSVPFIGGTSSNGIWTSDTSLGIVVAPGVQSGHAIAISMDSQYGSGFSAAYDYDPPAISMLDDANGPGSGGNTISVSGANFGTASYSAQVMIVGDYILLAELSRWVSDTMLMVKIPMGGGVSYDVAAAVCGLQGTLTAVYSYDAPSISAMHYKFESPPFIKFLSNGPQTGGSEPFIHGQNFGAVDLSLKGRIGGTSTITSHWTSDSSMSMKTPPSVDLSADVNVYMANMEDTHSSTLSDAFSYDSPKIEGIVPLTAVAGSTVTISGKNMGIYDTSMTASIGGTSCEAVEWQSTKAILCKTGGGVGCVHDVELTSAAGISKFGLADAFTFSQCAQGKSIAQLGQYLCHSQQEAGGS